MSIASLSRRGRLAFDFLFTDRDYLRSVWKIAVPIAIQQLVFSSLNLVNGVMVGQLGETAVAAVGLSGQIFFLFNLFVYGAASGAAIFTAQMWGIQDIPGIRRVLGFTLGLSGLIGAMFFIASLLAPAALIGVYSKDPAVVALGAGYLRIFSGSFLFTSVTFTYAIILRSLGQVRLPMFVSVVALTLNSLLAYTLIFGQFGAPRLGVEGAAIATLIARTLECLLIVFLTYRMRTPLAARLADFSGYTQKFVGELMTRMAPVTLTEVLWSLGVTTYYVIYARMGTAAVAAMNIVATIDQVAFVTLIAIGSACGVLVGNKIGAGEQGEAFRYGGRTLALVAMLGVGLGALLAAVSGLVLGLYRVGPEVLANARGVIYIIALSMWLRGCNFVLFIGILRSGGDTRFGFALDAGPIWVIGVPMAFLGAFVLGVPLPFVYLMALADEFTKFCAALYRFFSRRWIHNLARVGQE